MKTTTLRTSRSTLTVHEAETDVKITYSLPAGTLSITEHITDGEHYSDGFLRSQGDDILTGIEFNVTCPAPPPPEYLYTAIFDRPGENTDAADVIRQEQRRERDRLVLKADAAEQLAKVRGERLEKYMTLFVALGIDPDAFQ